MITSNIPIIVNKTLDAMNANFLFILVTLIPHCICFDDIQMCIF